MTNTKIFKVIIIVFTTKGDCGIGGEFKLLKKGKAGVVEGYSVHCGLLCGGIPSLPASAARVLDRRQRMHSC